MKRLIILMAMLLCITPLATATPVNFTPWQAYGDAWKANNDTYTIVMWNATGTHTWLATGNASSVNYLVVAGGGGGGSFGGGGGAGGFQAGSSFAVSGSKTVTVGVGGNGGTVNSGTMGNNSTFDTVTAIGGGFGGGGTGSGTVGGNGGSGGGGSTGTNKAGGSTIGVSQGYNGGDGANDGGSNYGAGGGGGAGSIGASSSGGTNGGNGGIGLISAITGTSTYYAAGGGGGLYGTASGAAGIGGSNIGGNGTKGSSNAGNAVVNTGSGGGGGGRAGTTSGNGGNGGSGIVIISYQTPGVVPPIITSFTSSPNPQTVGFPVVFTDTSTGTPTTWSWTFGDLDSGNTSTLQNPIRTYQTPGNYTVWLNATNATGIYSNYSHFQLINDLGVGHVDDYRMIALSSTAVKHQIDPSSMTYTAPSGQAITRVNLDVPLGTTGTFTITQSNGHVVQGSFSYTRTPTVDNVLLSKWILTIGGASQTEPITQPIIPLNMEVAISPGINYNSTSRGISAAYGQGIIGNAAWMTHIITEPTQTSPMMKFAFKSQGNINVVPYTDDYATTLQNWIKGAGGAIGDTVNDVSAWAALAKSWAEKAISVFTMLWYWLDFLFLRHLQLTVSLYITGSMAYAMFTSKNIFAFYKTWFKQQVALYQFVLNSFSFIIAAIMQVVKLI